MAGPVEHATRNGGIAQRCARRALYRSDRLYAILAHNGLSRWAPQGTRDEVTVQRSSNGNRQRAWKPHLQQLSDETGMAITVVSVSARNQQVNKIEQRPFPSSV